MLTLIERRASATRRTTIFGNQKMGSSKRKKECISSARQERLYVDSIAPPCNFHMLKFSYVMSMIEEHYSFM